MTRQRSLRVVEHDESLLPRIRALKAEHPFWGYRRLWAYLRFVEQLPVNKKRVWRVMREHHLLVPPNLRLKAKRAPQGSKPKPTKPNEWWGIDMTKVLVEGVDWVISLSCSIGIRKWWWATMSACDARPYNGWKRWTWRSTVSSPMGLEAKGCL